MLNSISSLTEFLCNHLSYCIDVFHGSQWCRCTVRCDENYPFRWHLQTNSQDGSRSFKFPAFRSHLHMRDWIYTHKIRHALHGCFVFLSAPPIKKHLTCTWREINSPVCGVLLVQRELWQRSSKVLLKHKILVIYLIPYKSKLSPCGRSTWPLLYSSFSHFSPLLWALGINSE